MSRPWTQEEIDKLIKLKREHIKVAEIAQRLDRTPYAVHERWHVLKRAGQDTYKCSRCREELPAERFAVVMRTGSGWCKSCERTYARERRQATPPRQRELIRWTGDTSRTDRSWTDEDTRKLREHIARGTHVNTVANELGRTPGAIYRRARLVLNENIDGFRCGMCTQHLPADQFYPDARYAGGWCITCRKDYSRSRPRRRKEQTAA